MALKYIKRMQYNLSILDLILVFEAQDSNTAALKCQVLLRRTLEVIFYSHVLICMSLISYLFIYLFV